MHARRREAALVAAVALALLAPSTCRAQAPAQQPAQPQPAQQPAQPQPAQQQDQQQQPAPAPKPRFRLPFPIGIDVGGYFPVSSLMTSRFGASPWFGVGAGIGAPTQPAPHVRLLFEYSMFYQKSGPDHAFFLPFGVGFRHAIGPRAPWRPYAGAAVYADLTDFHTVEDNVASRYRFGYGGSVAVGAIYMRRAFIEARYYALSHIEGFNPSGFEIKGGYRF